MFKNHADLTAFCSRYRVGFLTVSQSALEIGGEFLGEKDSYLIVKPFTVIGDKTYYGESVRLNILNNGRYEFAEEN